MPLERLIEDRMRFHGFNKTSLAERSGLSRPTLRHIMNGRGTISSLAQVLPPLACTWAWCPPASTRPGAALAELRRRRRLTQAQVSARLLLSRPVIIGIEKHMRGEVASLLGYTKLLGMPAPIAPISSKRRLIPASNAPERDRVMTPPALARAICGHFAPQMHGLILDPARGDGAFYDHFPGHLAKDWCEITDGSDFLAWKGRADWIVTNPPWSRLAEFMVQAMKTSDNIIFVAPLPNLTTKARLRSIHEAGFGIAELLQFETPREWPQSGFQLVAAWIRRGHAGACQFTSLEASASNSWLRAA
ncbi:hypothetical protein GI374_14605 [Paracoccus sp. S-4012]|uniref:helix-turn-helix domain-containing protein n=1 Tax=Paracoccus sp. S-4012 TaxID=2665648 RepID=UPI0012AF0F84|nr:helix-turn-helix transcriptional regulator [Paracoccus sp. S-4012]MRX51643.1 hypothetical protein [Paracoccus sp. S-4012]